VTRPHRQRRFPQRGDAELGHVVVIEDDPGIREALGSVLGDEGYRVEAFDNGQVAFNKLSSAARLPDAIILDLRLPGMDGWELRTRQRADPALSDIPVLAISADHSAKAAAIHADVFFHKPFDLEDLMAELERVLLERENRRLRQRLASVAHEIKNPLTFVTANLQEAGVLLTRVETDSAGELEELNVLLREARSGLDRIGTIVRDLGMMARPAHEHLEPVSLCHVVNAAIRMAANQIHRRATLTRDYRSAPSVMGSEVRLTQVFLNLLINACQAIPESSRRDHEIRVRIGTATTEAYVEIEDTGTGIDPAVLGRIFEPFFTTKPASQGAGLGLSICRDLVASQAGRIEVDSAPGRGSCFRVYLPLAHTTHLEE
jgi:signal transduction histidine kinase